MTETEKRFYALGEQSEQARLPETKICIQAVKRTPLRFSWNEIFAGLAIANVLIGRILLPLALCLDAVVFLFWFSCWLYKKFKA